MELISREMPANYNLIHTGDLHFGPANCNEEAIFEMVEYIASTPDTYVAIVGDSIDAIIIGDKRMHVTSFQGNTIKTPQQQSDRFIEIFWPIRDRILFIQLGNHEFKLINTFDFVLEWCNRLEVPWGGIMAKFIHLHEGKPQWKGFFCHGNGSIKSQAKDPIQALANQRALLKKKLQHLASDVVYMGQGHTHNMLLVNPTIQNHLHLIDDGKKIKQTYRVDVDQTAEYINSEARWYGCCGSFLSTMSQPGKGLISYGEMACYPPVEQGYIKLKIRDHKMVWADRVVC
jgi:hypothetical protein